MNDAGVIPLGGGAGAAQAPAQRRRDISTGPKTKAGLRA